MSINKDGLSLEQWKAAEIFAIGTKVKDKVVAKDCGVETSTIREWKKNPIFKLAVLKKFEENIYDLRSSRIGNMSKFLKPLYKAINKKLLKEKIEEEDYSLKALLDMVTKIHTEIRNDSIQFTRNKALLNMLAEYTGRDPDAISEEDEDIVDSAEQKYIERRKKAKAESENKVLKISKKRIKKVING